VPTSRFLFWNINRKPLAPVIADLAHEQRADIVALVECDIESHVLLKALNSAEGGDFHLAHGLSKGIRIFTRFSRNFVTQIFDGESERLVIRRLSLPARSEILLCVPHLPSKLHQTDTDQLFHCTELAGRIAAEEDKVGHQRTVLVGDLNMNPFETGVVTASGLHAVMSREVARGLSRTVQGREYRFFYNPMWNHFGDANSDTAGSYFYDASKQVSYFWNVFDQVLIRPELASAFDPASLQILKSVGNESLVRGNGRPDSTTYSDHLPIVFELAF
jgi:endonuclease/exonuclease/phosphatase family metal-dependent hydrolase